MLFVRAGVISPTCGRCWWRGRAFSVRVEGLAPELPFAVTFPACTCLPFRKCAQYGHLVLVRGLDGLGSAPLILGVKTTEYITAILSAQSKSAVRRRIMWGKRRF